MTSVTDQIRDNEIVELRLTEVPTAYCIGIFEMIEAFASNTSIEHVRLDRDFLPSMPDDDCIAFFEALGKLPNLKEAYIWHCAITVKAISAFLNKSKELKSLQLGCLHLMGESLAEFDEMADQLKNHATLTHFTMSDFSMNDDTVSIDHLVNNLATIPNLEKVKLEVTYSKRSSLVGSVEAANKVKVSLSGKALQSLVNAPSLKELHLSRLTFSNADFEALAQAIQTTPSLKALYMPHSNLDDQACVYIALAIANNSTLETVDLSCNKLSDEGCISIATALKTNKASAVKCLRLWGNVKISNAGFDALADMLEHNCVLERVPLMAPMEYSNRINTGLAKNRNNLTNQAA